MSLLYFRGDFNRNFAIAVVIINRPIEGFYGYENVV